MVFSVSRVEVGRTNKTHWGNQLRGIVLAFGEQQAEALGLGFQQLEELKRAEGKSRVYGL